MTSRTFPTVIMLSVILLSVAAPLLQFIITFILTRYNMTSGLYYKQITIVNDNSIMMLQVVVSHMIVILTTLEVSFMLLANIYSSGVTHDDRHVMIITYL